MDKSKIEGMLVGMAVGDALGAPVEFGYTAQKIRDEWSGEMEDHRIPAGYYTDDTAMALCLADSLLECDGYDSYDVMTKYYRWAEEGYRDSEGEPAPDIGNQTRSAIYAFKDYPVIYEGASRGNSAGNGTIMRLAPVVIASYESGLSNCRKLAKISARETHFSEEAEAGTELFATMLYNALGGGDKRSIIENTDVNGDEIYESVQARVFDVIYDQGLSASSLENLGGYIVDAIKIAAWGFLNFDDFEQGMPAVIKLGGDTDTNAAIYGQLAGAYYGYDAIPRRWLNGLHMREEIKELADMLYERHPDKIVMTRFEEDGENIYKQFDH